METRGLAFGVSKDWGQWARVWCEQRLGTSGLGFGVSVVWGPGGGGEIRWRNGERDWCKGMGRGVVI